MNKVYLNYKEIASFNSKPETIKFIEQLLSGKTEFKYNDTDFDLVEFKIKGEGMFFADQSDLNKDGKLTITEDNKLK